MGAIGIARRAGQCAVVGQASATNQALYRIQTRQNIGLIEIGTKFAESGESSQVWSIIRRDHRNRQRLRHRQPRIESAC